MPILQTLKGFVEYKIIHIFQKGNGMANDLAKQLVEYKISFESFHDGAQPGTDA